MKVGEKKVKIVHALSIHGLRSKLTTIGFDITEEIQPLLEKFSCPTTIDSFEAEITLYALSSIEEVPEWVLAHKRKVIARNTKQMGVVERLKLDLTLFQHGDRLVVDLHQHGVMVIHGPSGTAQGYVVDPNSKDPGLVSGFYHMSLSELMRWKGLFVIHAVGLERFGKGILITGRPNRGKTTAELSLLRSGYRFISDDFPFLRDNGRRVEMLSFQDWVDVREKSIGFFPELQSLELAPRFDGASKDSFSVHDLYPDLQTELCEIDLILFPQVVQGQDSYLEPMSKHHVLKEILPQGLQVHSQELAKREFQLYTKLVKQAPCYRLFFGQNRWDLSQLLDPLFEQCVNV